MILQCMLSYYGPQGIKEHLPERHSLGDCPVGALALVCTGVCPVSDLTSHSDLTTPSQIERGLLMYETGNFVDNMKYFSEKNWGDRTKIYVDLADRMTIQEWNNFFRALRTIGQELGEGKGSRSVANKWSNDPTSYKLAASDPVEPEDIVEDSEPGRLLGEEEVVEDSEPGYLLGGNHEGEDEGEDEEEWEEWGGFDHASGSPVEEDSEDEGETGGEDAKDVDGEDGVEGENEADAEEEKMNE